MALLGRRVPALVLASALAVSWWTGGAPSRAAAPDAAAALPDGPIDPAAAATAPRIAAAAAVLLDATTGAVLYAREMHRRRDPASTTKMMTALLALEYGNPGDPVRISRRAAGTPGSRMGLRAGEVYTLADLLAGLLLSSGNDAAVAIAEHLSGSVEAFAELMNRRARELGMLHTRFRNPHGLTEQGHYTTAYDLALLARRAMEQPLFRDLVCRRSGSVCDVHGARPRVLWNTNALLSMYELAEGVKTGTTSAAGRCLVASASRDGQRLLAVLLDAPRRFADARDLLEWGFATFSLRRVARSGERVAQVPVAGGTRTAVSAVAAEDLWVVAPRAAWGTPRLAWRAELPGGVRAPVKRHAALGRVEVLLDGRPVASARLVAGERVPRRNWTARLAAVVARALALLAGQ